MPDNIRRLIAAPWFAATLLFIAVFAFYAHTAKFAFVDFDDNEYVFDNPRVLSGLSPKNVWWALTDVGYAANWHPLTWWSLMADTDIAGVHPQRLKGMVYKDAHQESRDFDRLSEVMHFHNAILHALNAALLLLLMYAWAKGFGGGPRLEAAESGVMPASVVAFAFTVCLVWALHPLRAEVVCWTSERKELICTAASLATLLCCAKDRPILAFVFCSAALLAKPMAVTLPAVALCADWMIRGRLRIWRFVVMMVPAMVCAALTLLAQKEAMPGKVVPFARRLPNAVASVGTYLVETFCPRGLVAMYPFPARVNWWLFALGAFIIVVCAALCARWLVRWMSRSTRATHDWLSAATFGIVWCAVGLMPVIGIIQVGSQAHADRYTYWVGCGVASAATLVVLTLAPRIRAVALAAAVCAVVALIPPALRQCGTWSTSAALYEHAFRETGSAWSAFSLGESHVRSDPARAEFYYRAAIADRPEDESLAALAVLLAVRPGNDDLAEPRACAEASLKINPKNWRAWEALGFVGMRTKDFPLAARAFSEALKNGSDNPMVERLAAEAAQRARPGPWRN